MAVPIVGAMVVREGKVLLGRRALDRPTYPGCWDLVGGHVEEGESTEYAIRREVSEELGITPTKLARLARKTLFKPPIGEVDYHIYAIFRWDGGEPRLKNHEHIDLRWFTPTEARAVGEMSLQNWPILFGEAVQMGSSLSELE